MNDDVKDAPNRMSRADRRAWLLKNMTEYVRDNGLNFTGKVIEEHLKVSRIHANIYFGGVGGLIDEIIGRAIERNDLVVMGRGVQVGHRYLMDVARVNTDKARRAAEEHDARRAAEHGRVFSPQERV